MRLPRTAKLVHLRLPADAAERLEVTEPRKGITHNFNHDDLPDGGQLIGLISCDGTTYDAVSVIKKETHTSTFQVRVRLQYIQAIQPMPITDIVDGIRDRLAVHVKKCIAKEIAAFPAKSADAVIARMLAIRPSVAVAFQSIVSHLAGRRKFRIPEHSSWAVIAQEKDAIDAALALGELPLSGFDGEVDATRPPAGIMDILSGQMALEDRQIEVDAASFGGLRAFRTDIRGARVYFDGRSDSVVKVFNVNRHSLERTLGVDLIIYYERFKSYVLIQYKRLIPAEIRVGSRTRPEMVKVWRYYRDANFQNEVDRIDAMRRRLLDQGSRAPSDYRLNDDPFYFKFCRADVIDADARGMVSGLHVLAKDVSHFLSSEHSRGTRGGQYIGYDNLNRRFPNSLFIELVRQGWIGSRSMGSEAIEECIRSSLDSHRSVILANVKTQADPPSHADQDLPLDQTV